MRKFFEDIDVHVSPEKQKGVAQNYWEPHTVIISVWEIIKICPYYEQNYASTSHSWIIIFIEEKSYLNMMEEIKHMWLDWMM